MYAAQGGRWRDAYPEGGVVLERTFTRQDGYLELAIEIRRRLLNSSGDRTLAIGADLSSDIERLSRLQSGIEQVLNDYEESRPTRIIRASRLKTEVPMDDNHAVD